MASRKRRARARSGSRPGSNSATKPREERSRLAWLVATTPGRITTLLTTISTIVGILVAVKALLPKSPEALTARFSQITANPEVSLEEYDARAKAQIADAGSIATLDATGYRLAASTTATTAGHGEGESAKTSAGTAPGSGEGKSGGEAGESTSTQPTTPTTTTTTTTTTSTPIPTTATTSPPRTRLQRPAAPMPRRQGGRIVTRPHDVPYPAERSQRQASSQTLAQPPPETERTVAGARVTDGAGVPAAKVASVFSVLACVAEASAGGAPPREPEASSAEAQTRSSASPLPPAGAPASSGESTERETRAARVVIPARCRSAICGATQEVEKALTYDPNPARAAQAVAALFKSSRAELVGRNLYPLGAEVSYDLVLKGFAHRRLTLEWSLLGRARRRALARPWWHNVVVAHITPTVAEQSLTGKFWVPEPPERGDYIVHLVLLDEHGTAYAASDSAPAFH